MKNPELCCNCAYWTLCKEEGSLPNDYCGMYVSAYGEDDQEVREYCRAWRKEHGICNGCKYSTPDHDCSVYELTRGATGDE